MAASRPLRSCERRRTLEGEPERVGDDPHHLSLAFRSDLEVRPPLAEGLVGFGDRPQPHLGHIVLDRKCRLEDAITADVLTVGEGEQLLPDQPAAVLGAEVPHAADLVGGETPLDMARREETARVLLPAPKNAPEWPGR